MIKISEAFIDAVLELSDNEHSKLSERERELFGLSSTRLRAFLNNLCSKENTKYVEIGTYRGATLLSAVYGNKAKAIGVEHFKYDEREPLRKAPEGTIWENMRSHLYANIERYKDPDVPVNTDAITIVESDFKQVDWSKIPKFDVCFFDITPVNKHDYESFFNLVWPRISAGGVAVFSNYSNDHSSKLLDEVIEESGVKVAWKRKRISSGLSDATKYYSGILILGVDVKDDK